MVAIEAKHRESIKKLGRENGVLSGRYLFPWHQNVWGVAAAPISLANRLLELVQAPRVDRSRVLGSFHLSNPQLVDTKEVLVEDQVHGQIAAGVASRNGRAAIL